MFEDDIHASYHFGKKECFTGNIEDCVLFLIVMVDVRRRYGIPVGVWTK